MKKIVCVKCKAEICGGFYNTPRGAFCSKCWEKVPQKRKDKDLKEALIGLAAIGRCLR